VGLGIGFYSDFPDDAAPSSGTTNVVYSRLLSDHFEPRLFYFSFETDRSTILILATLLNMIVIV